VIEATRELVAGLEQSEEPVGAVYCFGVYEVFGAGLQRKKQLWWQDKKIACVLGVKGAGSDVEWQLGKRQVDS
jgi:hypothetical protein